jgi:hypothetical protein
MIINSYDEFGTYTTTEDIEIYIEQLILDNPNTDEDTVFNLSVNHFGRNFISMIEYIMYGED